MSHYSGLPQVNSLVLLHDYTKGSFLDLSPNTSNDGTPTGVNWEKRGSETHLRYTIGTADKVTVADHSSLHLTAATFVYFGEGLTHDTSAGDKRIIYKESEFDLVIRPVGTQIRVTVSGGVYNLDLGNMSAAKSIIISMANNDYARGYVDGVYIDISAATQVMVAGTSPLYLGNYKLGTAYTIQNLVKGFIIYNTKLTDTEVSQAHQWCMARRSPVRTKAWWRGAALPSRLKPEASLVGAWDLGDLQSGSVVDRSSNGHDGAATAGVQNISTAIGKAAQLDGQAGHVVVTDAADLSFGDGTDDSPFSISAIVNMVDATEFPILAKGVYNTDAEYRLFIDNADKIHFQTFDESVADCYIGRKYDTTLTSSQDKWLHVVATYSAATETSADFTIYLNGVPVDDADSELNAGSYDAMEPLAGDVHLGRNATLYADGAVRQARLWSKELSATEVQELYLTELASLPTFIDDLSDANVSVAVEGGAVSAPLSNTDWLFGDTAGRYRVSEDTIDGEVQKVIECTTAGLLYQEMQQAYGTWEFDLYKDLTANVADVIFCADTIGGGDAAGQDGYGIRFDDDETIAVIESTAGAAADLISSAVKSLQTWYTVRVTRRFDGRFDFYLDDVAIGNATDTTVKTSTYLVLDLDVGDQIANLQFYTGTLDPT